MIINERNKTTVPRAFFPSDYKRMEDQGFKPKGWNTYQESPYKDYHKMLEELGYERHDKLGNREKEICEIMKYKHIGDTK